jgi:hypothetical protein
MMNGERRETERRDRDREQKTREEAIGLRLQAEGRNRKKSWGV